MHEVLVISEFVNQ